VAAAAPDDEAELALVVEERRDARPVDRLSGTRDAGRLLVEEDGKGRRLQARLLDVVGIVEADAEELRRAEDRRLETHVGEREAGSRVRRRTLRCGQRCGTAGEQGHHLAREVRCCAREIYDALGSDHADAGRAVMRERGELHARCLLPTHLQAARDRGCHWAVKSDEIIRYLRLPCTHGERLGLAPGEDGRRA
jgi:hypothetical protein